MASRRNSEFETITLIGVGDGAVLHFENGGTYSVEGLVEQMSLLRKHEQSRRVASLEEHVAQIGQLIESTAKRDLDRLDSRGTRIRQFSIVGDERFHLLPWELLSAAEGTWHDNLPIVRRVLEYRDHEPTEPVDEELRILLATARPAAADISPRAVVDPLLRSLENGWTDPPRLTVLRTGTFADLSERLRRQRDTESKTHIVHLDLHGTVRHTNNPDGSVEKQASVFFEAEPQLDQGNAWISGDAVSPKRLASLLREVGVEVVVLNACRSASDVTGANFALELCREGVPAVVAMRRRVSVRAASDFVSRFYLHLSDSSKKDLPLTKAVQSTRQELIGDHPIEATYPALYIRRTPALPRHQSDAKELRRRRRLKTRANSVVPETPILGRVIDERVMRAHVFGRGSLKGEKLRPVELVGWRGVGKSSFMKSMAAHWLDADLVDDLVWCDLSDPEDVKLLRNAPEIGDALEQKGFDPLKQNLIVVDHAEQIDADDELADFLWDGVGSLEAQFNAVVLLGRTIPWARDQHVKRRFTMRRIDVGSASHLLKSQGTRQQQRLLRERCHRVPSILEKVQELDNSGKTAQLVDDLDRRIPSPEDALKLRTELFGDVDPKLLDELGPFSLLEQFVCMSPSFLESLGVDDASDPSIDQLAKEGLLIELPLQPKSAATSFGYLPHPLLPWLGSVAAATRNASFEKEIKVRDGIRKTYWGGRVRVLDVVSTR